MCTKTAPLEAVADSEHTICDVFTVHQYQKQQGSLQVEQEDLLFQPCCSSLDANEKMSLFILLSFLFYLLFCLEL